jgi:serine/threonine-protein kinase
MAPEQAAAFERVDGRADLYSVGAVAYHLLTGQPPFTSKNVLGLLAAHRNTPVRPPSQINPAIPTDLDAIVVRCLAKNPADRFPDAGRLRHALEECSLAGAWGSEQAAQWWRSPSGYGTGESDIPSTTTAHCKSTVDYEPNDS